MFPQLLVDLVWLTHKQKRVKTCQNAYAIAEMEHNKFMLCSRWSIPYRDINKTWQRISQLHYRPQQSRIWLTTQGGHTPSHGGFRFQPIVFGTFKEVFQGWHVMKLDVQKISNILNSIIYHQSMIGKHDYFWLKRNQPSILNFPSPYFCQQCRSACDVTFVRPRCECNEVVFGCFW